MIYESDNLSVELENGAAVIRLDVADRSVNTLGSAMIEQLGLALDAIEALSQQPEVVVIASNKPDSFINGADLFEMRTMDRPAIERYLREGQSLMNRLAGLKLPTVATIDGHCLGGGLELALACDHRVVADRGSINLGLPEVRLGIVPAWGGTTRLVRQVGPVPALDLMLNGRMLPPRKARKLGLVDDTVRAEALPAAARRLASKPVTDRRHWLQRMIAALPPLAALVCGVARRRAKKESGGHYPAADRLIDVVQAGLRHGEAAGFEAERAAAIELGEGEVAQNLMRLFFLRHEAKEAVKQLGETDAPVQRAAVIGGGTMGAGIAAALAQNHIEVHLIDIDVRAAGAGKKRAARLIDKAARANRLSPTEAAAAKRRIWPAADWAGLEQVDLVIEAASEKLSIKSELFEKLEAIVPSETVLATNTSSLSIARIAEPLEDPDRLIGLHFFNPVHKMPLVEVVRTDRSRPHDLAVAAETALRLGKTPILVADAPGFAVNRLLFPYLIEAARAAGDGLSIERIDRAAKDFGMPMGPFELMDEVGLDVASHILESVRSSLEHLPVPESLDQLGDAGLGGRKSGEGFYLYKNGRRDDVNETLRRKLFGSAQSEIEADAEHLAERLVLPMVNEAVRLLEEGVIDSAGRIDLATVLGLGFAPFRGGLMRYAQQRGEKKLLESMVRLAQAHGAHLGPHPKIREAVETDQTLREVLGQSSDRESAAREQTERS